MKRLLFFVAIVNRQEAVFVLNIFILLAVIMLTRLLLKILLNWNRFYCKGWEAFDNHSQFKNRSTQSLLFVLQAI